MCFKISSVKWCPFCLGLNALSSVNGCEIILGIIKTYLHFLSFLDTKIAKIVRIFPGGRHGPADSVSLSKYEEHWVDTLRPRQNGCHFPDDIFRCIFLNENVQITIKISLEFVIKGPINNTPALVQIMAWRRPGDKPFAILTKSPSPSSLLPIVLRTRRGAMRSGPTSELTHICVTRPQWVKERPML